MPATKSRRGGRRTAKPLQIQPDQKIEVSIQSYQPLDQKSLEESMVKGLSWASQPKFTPPSRPTVPVIPYFSTSWQQCANSFASNVDCVIAINVPAKRLNFAFWRSAIKTLQANTEGENEKRRSQGKPEIQVKIIGYINPHQSQEDVAVQTRRYRKDLGIQEFWLDDRADNVTVKGQLLAADHYGTEHDPLPLRRAQDGILRVGYATGRTWEDQWNNGAKMTGYCAMTEDVGLMMPPNWWRQWLKAVMKG